MSAPLPAFWSQEKDEKGRTYYSNHATKETTWERPVATAAAVPQEPPPTYGTSGTSGGGAPTHQAYGSSAGVAPAPQRKGPCCTPRLTFWITCGLGWIVWIFALVASVDDDWIEDQEIAAGDEDILDNCDNDSDFCKQYKAFTAMQFVAVLLVSFAMVVFVVTFFRPRTGGCCNVKVVAWIGASLMAGFAFFQMLAFVLMIVIEKDADEERIDYKLGGTFAVGVIACIMGIVHSATIFIFARSAGDGLFYKCCHECMAMNSESNAGANSGAGGPAYATNQQQQPVPPTAVTTAVPPQAPVAAATTAVPSQAPAAPPEPASAAV